MCVTSADKLPGKIKRKKLLVEGAEDKRVIPWLIEANGIPWGETRQQAIVHIEDFDGIENLLAPNAISVELKASGLEIIGIMVDADESVEDRWKRIRQLFLDAFPQLPEEFPKQGLIHSNENGLKLGVWIMPDNQTGGMLLILTDFVVLKNDTGSEDETDIRTGPPTCFRHIPDRENPFHPEIRCHILEPQKPLEPVIFQSIL